LPHGTATRGTGLLAHYCHRVGEDTNRRARGNSLPCACGTGHRRGATRRRCAHPLVDALAGEGARGGAAIPPPAATAVAVSSPSRVTEKERGGEKELGSGPRDHDTAMAPPPDPTARRQERSRRCTGLCRPRKSKERKKRRASGWTGSGGGVPRWRRRQRGPVAMGGRRRAAQIGKGRRENKLGLGTDRCRF
jgi:hypothetical protein